MVGAAGFEPAISRSRSGRFCLTKLHASELALRREIESLSLRRQRSRLTRSVTELEWSQPAFAKPLAGKLRRCAEKFGGPGRIRTCGGHAPAG
jgi:hypothetical protein